MTHVLMEWPGRAIPDYGGADFIFLTRNGGLGAPSFATAEKSRRKDPLAAWNDKWDIFS